MLYQEARDFIAKHTNIVELTNQDGARVVVAPAWQGRVMTSTVGGPQGPSFGFVNSDFIASGKVDPQFNNYGAEDRFWLCPEGGQFSLWFEAGAKQVLDNWHTPAAIDRGPWNVASQSDDAVLRMTTAMEFRNTAGTTFKLDVARDVRLLAFADYRELFGASAAVTMTAPGVKIVGYETANQITNRGSALSKKTGLVSIWILGMLNPGPETVLVCPYKPGPEEKLGPVVKSDYGSPAPPERLKVLPQAVLFRTDAQCRSKIGLSQQRARNIFGSIDFQAGVLTLIAFTMPEDPTKHNYLNNIWEATQAEPYKGDVINSYNDGANETGHRFGPFYEVESISPAPELKTGETLAHRHSTIHIQADAETLATLAKDILGVDLATVRKSMLAK